MVKSKEDALEVSAQVWLDDEIGEWMYSVFIIHNNEEEELHAWGTVESKAKGAEIVGAEITNYFA